VRIAVAATLRTFGPKAESAVPALTRALEDDDAGMRAAAASALSKIAPERLASIPAWERGVEESLDEEDLTVRLLSAAALWEANSDSQLLAKAISSMRQDPEVKERLTNVGLVSRLFPEDFSAFLLQQ
jgi:HEAT repeat protein